DLDPLKHLSDRVGERSAAGQQYDPTAPPKRGQGFNYELEGAGFAEQASADFHDRVNQWGVVRHDGNSSATAAAGACRAAGPRVSERCVTCSPMRRAAAAARNSPSPVTTARVNVGCRARTRS